MTPSQSARHGLGYVFRFAPQTGRSILLQIHGLAVVGDTVTNSGSVGDVSYDADVDGEGGSVESSGITAVKTWSSKSIHLQSSRFSNKLPLSGINGQSRVVNDSNWKCFGLKLLSVKGCFLPFLYNHQQEIRPCPHIHAVFGFESGPYPLD